MTSIKLSSGQNLSTMKMDVLDCKRYVNDVEEKMEEISPGAAPTNETSKLIQDINNERVVMGVEHMFRKVMGLITVLILVLLLPAFMVKNNRHLGGTRQDSSSQNHDLLMPIRLQQASTTAVQHRPAFPSYLTYASSGPMNVTYDKRSIIINGERVVFLSGSIHPVRLTPKQWNLALDDAVRHGLNMVTIYVFWNVHQPFPGKFDWSLPGGGTNDDVDIQLSQWTLAAAIREAGSRGLFVHIRIGPYDCAEYNYGGIPEWVPLSDTSMEMRRPNVPWMRAMEKWVAAVTNYFTANQLWSYQGGPIILSQIENELGSGKTAESYMSNDNTGDITDSTKRIINTIPPSTMQGYADWCGDLASRLVPNVVWTMCNGLTAHNTINTCNGNDCVAYLQNHGQTGRIQIDQPALWTENEQGFQLWGEEPSNPKDYFWGRTARDTARDILRWFARGGSHMNHYMWLGGYNRGRAAGAGIMNAYASDAPMCPSGERRQPKFDHLQALHGVVTDIAYTLMHEPSAMKAARTVEKKNKQGKWQIDQKNQRMFVYGKRNNNMYPFNEEKMKEVIFVENDDNADVILRVPIENGQSTKIVIMKPKSAIVISNGLVVFDSATIHPQAMSYERHTGPPEKEKDNFFLDWKHWIEPRGAPPNDPRTTIDSKPIEQTELMLSKGISSDYAWYETEFTLDDPLHDATIHIQTDKANAMVAFVDGYIVGAVDNHDKSEGQVLLSIDVGSVTVGNHTLSILSESLGYFNLIGRWGASTGPKKKGVTGNIWLKGNKKKGDSSFSQNLVDGRPWRSFAGLQGNNAWKSMTSSKSQQPTLPCTWHSARFETPNLHKKSFYLDLTGGRGHVWVNGYDLGRFWNITRDPGDASAKYSQQYYMVPSEVLKMDGSSNELVIFNALGADISTANGVLSWISPSDSPILKDEVDFPNACLV